MTPNRYNPYFTPDCTKSETIIGWVYLLLHMFAFPLALAPVQQRFFPNASAAEVNFAYFALAMVVTAVFFGKMLRREFDHFCDRPLQCLKGILLGYGLWYALSMLLTSLMMTMGWETTSPNDEAIGQMAAGGYNLTLVMSVIFAPIAEEVLFRGVVFQSLRSKNRLLAYLVSLGLFGLYHVWQYAYVYGDLRYLLHMVQYVPITFVLTWCYEYSGSLWTPILFHASNNYLAMQLMQMMQS